jgi:hypothetical protein
MYVGRKLITNNNLLQRKCLLTTLKDWVQIFFSRYELGSPQFHFHLILIKLLMRCLVVDENAVYH